MECCSKTSFWTNNDGVLFPKLSFAPKVMEFCSQQAFGPKVMECWPTHTFALQFCFAPLLCAFALPKHLLSCLCETFLPIHLSAIDGAKMAHTDFPPTLIVEFSFTLSPFAPCFANSFLAPLFVLSLLTLRFAA